MNGFVKNILLYLLVTFLQLGFSKCGKGDKNGDNSKDYDTEWKDFKKAHPGFVVSKDAFFDWFNSNYIENGYRINVKFNDTSKMRSDKEIESTIVDAIKENQKKFLDEIMKFNDDLKIFQSKIITANNEVANVKTQNEINVYYRCRITAMKNIELFDRKVKDFYLGVLYNDCLIGKNYPSARYRSFDKVFDEEMSKIYETYSLSLQAIKSQILNTGSSSTSNQSSPYKYFQYIVYS